MGYEVYNFNYPTPKGQNFENWSKVLDKVKDKITQDIVFICHSIAPIFLIKYCINNNIKIGKLISVSGINNFKGGIPEFDEINKFMFVDDVSNFIDLCDERICIYSNNDPYIKIEELKNFANSIKVKQIVFENAGHFNEKAGYTKFEYILTLL